MNGSINPARSEWDVIVVGGAPPGETISLYSSFAGLSVALVEQDRVGGECLFWACMPSKAMLLPVHARNLAVDLPGMRQLVNGRRVDADAVLARRDEITYNHDDKQSVDLMLSHDVDVLRGRGRLVGPKTVEVSDDGRTREITATQAVVLSPGTDGALPPITGLADARPWRSRDVTNMHEVPRRMVVIGGGVVACEAATWLRGLGVEELTLVFPGERLLEMKEPFVGELVRQAFEADGITVRTGTPVHEVLREKVDDRGIGRTHGDEVTVTVGDGERLVADEVLVATGRVPNSRDIGLEAVGVPTTDRGFVEVDDHLTVPGTDWLYVLGDLNGRALLTHMGKYHARIAGEVIAARAAGKPLDERPFNPYTDQADKDGAPQVVFCDPEVASVGLTEAEALDREIPVEVVERDFAGIDGARLAREHYVGRAKLVIDNSTDTLVGVTFVGSGVSELLHAATVAVVGKVPVSVLRHAVASFPTISEIWLYLLEELRQRRAAA
ncbi:dihydrolipoamide dehydrogenase [Asanoa ferruginea]|uniref:Dihydrolipoamide dehydrogenase n=1 Tax=Asanoa ferruginea TaxID=53367 RepID=A0A3D9ZR52_9ACTN|nr:NAD(P)/FAD-dependent oxidoreductase [Asanoa ferruginea]REF98463.1 dihydrolipoamide dehydrogenase [Asanoa ferruginea]GIF52830.1 oxidoreductase [Asanoa ferruginea]